MGLPKDSGLKLFAKWPSGPKNLITDVPGVRVGQVTLKDEKQDIHTGVTAIIPHEGDIFLKACRIKRAYLDTPVIQASGNDAHVLAYGKTLGVEARACA